MKKIVVGVCAKKDGKILMIQEAREDIYKFTVESKEMAKSALPRTILRNKSFR